MQVPKKDWDFWYNRIWSKLQILQWTLVEVGELIEELKKEYQRRETALSMKMREEES